MTVKVEQSTASLLPPNEKPTPPSSGPGDVLNATPTPSYTDDWVRKFLAYCGGLIAAEWGPEMRITELEAALLTPPLTAVLNAHAPDAVSGANPDASLKFVMLLVLLMGGRRALIVRRNNREAKKGKQVAGDAGDQKRVNAPKDQASAPPAPETAAQNGEGEGGMFGHKPVILGGNV